MQQHLALQWGCQYLKVSALEPGAGLTLQRELTAAGSPDPDELVRNSWSAKRDVAIRAAIAVAETDPDELVRNSWSA